MPKITGRAKPEATKHASQQDDPTGALTLRNATPEIHEQYLMHISSFVIDVDCVHEMFTQVMPLLTAQDKARSEKSDELTNVFITLAGRIRRSKRISPATMRALVKAVSEIKSVRSSMRRLNRANVLFRLNAIAGLVTRWEEYFGALLGCMFEAHPGRLSSHSRSLAFEDAAVFDSPGSLKRWFIARAVEDVVSKSRQQQMEYFESQIGVKCSVTMPGWPELLEIGERRHLFVHNGGTVDRKYLERCRQMGARLPKSAVLGKRLGVSDAYFGRARSVLIDVGVQFGQRSFRKLFPSFLDYADDALNSIGVTFLQEREWDLAERLYAFAGGLEADSVSSAQMQLVYRMNRCIALKWLGRSKELVAILEATDISAAKAKFALAVAVLREQWGEAERLLPACVKAKEVTQDDCADWPLFMEFRAREEFRRAYRAAFRRDFAAHEAAALSKRRKASHT